MKKISFEVVFKIVVFLLLSAILILCYNISETDSNHYYPTQQPSEIGRYKVLNSGNILGTKTGEVYQQGIGYRYK